MRVGADTVISASKRPQIVVPAALLAIFGLFMAFGSGGDALIDISGVPLALTGSIAATSGAESAMRRLVTPREPPRMDALRGPSS